MPVLTIYWPEALGTLFVSCIIFAIAWGIIKSVVG
jgi:divalent metal cation (Fe/Co/Zn/Cd) transporter